MDTGIQLFDTGANEMVMPGVNKLDTKDNKEEVNLVSEGIERAITGDTVKSLMIPEDLEISLPNYILDLCNVDPLYEFQAQGIDALLHPDGDTTIYAYTPSGLVKLARGLSDILDRILTISIANLFNGQAIIYKDFEPGKPLSIISDKDITTMRLGL